MPKRVPKSRQRVPREYGCGTLTRAMLFGRIRSVLRNGFRFWPPIQAVRKRCRVGRGRYKCEECGTVVGTKEFQVDHIVPCGSMRAFEDIGPWVERLLVEEDGLRGLCKRCHKLKTDEERKNT